MSNKKIKRKANESLRRKQLISALYNAAQGLAFWAAYKKTFYPNYHINEGAITAEFATLARALLPSGFSVGLETPYGGVRGIGIQRCDVSIFLREKTGLTTEFAMIELKTLKHGSGIKPVLDDIEKLDALEHGNARPLKYVVVLTQNSPPDDLIAKNGRASRALERKYPGAKVRRVLRAAKTLDPTSASTVHTIVIEVQ